MKDLNDCKFIGNLTRDPDVKYMPNGDAVTNFSIACNDDYKKDGELVKVVNFINVVAFRKAGELIGQHCLKGTKLFVSGKMRARKWQHSDGSDRYTTEIIADQFQFLGRPAKQSSDNGSGNAALADDGFNDDIPF